MTAPADRNCTTCKWWEPLAAYEYVDDGEGNMVPSMGECHTEPRLQPMTKGRTDYCKQWEKAT